MNSNELKKYLIQCLNMALGIEGESTYTNSFDIEILRDGFIFKPAVPSTFILNNHLYNRIFQLASGVLYPKFTLLKQSGTYFVKTSDNDMHSARGLFFPWYQGIPERIIIDDLSFFLASKVQEKSIPLMENLDFDYEKIYHLAIAGNSGSGKSQSLIYLMSAIKSFSDMVIVDPKFDSPSKFAHKYGIRLIKPENNRSQNDFVNQISEMLSEYLSLIHQRQHELFDNPFVIFRHQTIVIDELLALTTGVSKQIQADFFSLLSQIALLGRSTKIHLILVSQRFDNTALPISVREQCNMVLQLGNINKKTTQFLFPDLDNSEDIVIPQGVATGIIQLIDDVHSNNIMPILMPTVKEWL